MWEGRNSVVIGWKPLTIITKHFILDNAVALDPPLVFDASDMNIAK